MNTEEILLPLFPATGVLVPYGAIKLVVTDEPYLQLIHDCTWEDKPFAVVHFDAERGTDVGCAARVVEAEQRDGMLICEVEGLKPFEIVSVVSFEGDRQRVLHRDREVVFEQEEPLDLPYLFVCARFFEEAETPVREDLKTAVMNAVLARVDQEDRAMVQELFDDGLNGQLSYWVLHHFVPDDTEEGNRTRIDFLKKRSENKRFRMLRHLLVPEVATPD